MAAALCKENQELKQQIQTFSVELESLKSLFMHQRAAESHETQVTSLDAETKSNFTVKSMTTLASSDAKPKVRFSVSVLD